MTIYKGFKELHFSKPMKKKIKDEALRNIVNSLIDITLASCEDNYNNGMINKKFSLNGFDYVEKERTARKAALAYAAKKSGIDSLEDEEDLICAFDNPTFVSVWNAIASRTLQGVMINSGEGMLGQLANVDNVKIGDSMTYEIETKGLPIAQRNSYTSNVVFLDGYTKQPVTITPKVYTTGSQIDYIRVLDDTFDWGKELARVAMSLLYAQYRLVIGVVFNSSNLTGTPLYQSDWNETQYIKNIDSLKALNKVGVAAYGTLTSFQAQGSLSTTNRGFGVTDEYIRNGMLGRAYGVQNFVIEQATDLSAPFIDANVEDLLLVPTNQSLLLPNSGDKPAKLVRESFVRVLSKEPTRGSRYTLTYSYTNSFDAGLATQAHYSIQEY